VYLPATSTTLRQLGEESRLAEVPLTAFAVTVGLREWYSDDDIEELEYAAARMAARASLRLLDVDAAAARRRAVVSADVPDATVTVRDDLDHGVVYIGEPVPLSLVAAVHVDDQDAEAAVTVAAAVVLEADLGLESAQDTVDDAEGYELSWYAPHELGDVLEKAARNVPLTVENLAAARSEARHDAITPADRNQRADPDYARVRPSRTR
jgi:hypothetical protein